MATIARTQRRSWTRNLVVETIQYRYQHQMVLNPQGLEVEDPSLLAAGRRYFGSWPNALASANVPAVPRTNTQRYARGHWTRDRLLQEIQRHADEGHPLYAHAMQQMDNRLVSAATYHFGSWGQALAAAGFDPQAIRANRHHSADSVIAELHALMGEGDSLDVSTVRKHNRTLYWAARKHFGSWWDALAVAAESRPNAVMVPMDH